MTGSANLHLMRGVSESLAGRAVYLELAPFTLAETREYVQRRVERMGGTSVDQLFEYHAIPLLHELSEGVPDMITALVSRCREMADAEGLDLVTTQLVKRSQAVKRMTTVTTNSRG